MVRADINLSLQFSKTEMHFAEKCVIHSFSFMEHKFNHYDTLFAVDVFVWLQKHFWKTRLISLFLFLFSFRYFVKVTNTQHKKQFRTVGFCIRFINENY